MIYVDELAEHPPAKEAQARRVGARNGHRWCHMISDQGEAELVAFAVRIGMRREWLQRGSTLHFDLTPVRRAAAVAAGAVELGRRDFVNLCRRLRGAPPIPEVAVG